MPPALVVLPVVPPVPQVVSHAGLLPQAATTTSSSGDAATKIQRARRWGERCIGPRYPGTGTPVHPWRTRLPRRAPAGPHAAPARCYFTPPAVPRYPGAMRSWKAGAAAVVACTAVLTGAPAAARAQGKPPPTAAA